MPFSPTPFETYSCNTSTLRNNSSPFSPISVNTSTSNIRVPNTSVLPMSPPPSPVLNYTEWDGTLGITLRPPLLFRQRRNALAAWHHGFHRSLAPSLLPHQNHDESTWDHGVHNSLVDNMWHRDMIIEVQHRTNESCYVCSYIPHAVGADRLIFPNEVPPRIAKCLFHAFLCRIRGQIQVNRVNIFEVYANTTLWDHTPIVFVVITDRAQLGGELEDMHGRQVAYLKNKAAFTRQHGFLIISAPSATCNLTLCFLGNGRIPVGCNTNCSSTIFYLDLQWGTSRLMDFYWAWWECLYLQLPPRWSSLRSLEQLMKSPWSILQQIFSTSMPIQWLALLPCSTDIGGILVLWVDSL